jgi:hypothetical protein
LVFEHVIRKISSPTKKRIKTRKKNEFKGMPEKQAEKSRQTGP